MAALSFVEELTSTGHDEKEHDALDQESQLPLLSTSSSSSTCSTNSGSSSCTKSSKMSGNHRSPSLKSGSSSPRRSSPHTLPGSAAARGSPSPPPRIRRTTPFLSDNFQAQIKDSLSPECMERLDRIMKEHEQKLTKKNLDKEQGVEVSLTASPPSSLPGSTTASQSMLEIIQHTGEKVKQRNQEQLDEEQGENEKTSLLHIAKSKGMTKEQILSYIKTNMQTPNRPIRNKAKRNNSNVEMEFQLSPESRSSSKALSPSFSMTSKSPRSSPTRSWTSSSSYPSPTRQSSSPISPPKFNRQNVVASLPFQMPPLSKRNNGRTVGNDEGTPINQGEASSSSFPAAVTAAAIAAAISVNQQQQKMKYKMQEQHLMRVLQSKRDFQGIRSDSTPSSQTESFSSSSVSSSTSSRSALSSLEKDYEMIIHPQSVPGTTEAAAWHLHGQTGGRRSKPGADSNDNGTAVMYASAMQRMRVCDKMREEKRENEHEHVNNPVYGDVYEVDYNDVKSKNSTTGVTIQDLEAGITTITSSEGAFGESENKSDMWSTGVATAVAMGIVSRYNKTLCMFPHGRRVLLPIMMGILAFTLSMVTSLSCQFMTILPVQQNHQVFQVGPWRYLSTDNDYEVCLPYPSDIDLDSFFMISRAASALASCFGGGLVLWTSTLTCLSYSRQSLSGLGVCFFFTSILQLFTAFFYQSDNCKGGGQFDEYGNSLGGGYFGGVECKPNQDLVFCIAASLLYFATGLMLYVAQKFISAPGFSTAEVYTWSAVVGSSNMKKGILRTVEKCWAQLPDGSTCLATVLVEKRKGKDGKTKTTHSIQTEILPA